MGLRDRLGAAVGAGWSALMERDYEPPAAVPVALPQTERAAKPAPSPTPVEVSSSPTEHRSGTGDVAVSGSGTMTTADQMIGRLMLPDSVRQYPRFTDRSFLVEYERMPALRLMASLKAGSLAALQWDYLSARTATGRRAVDQLRRFHPRDDYDWRQRRHSIARLINAKDAESLPDSHPAVAFFRRGVLPYLTGFQVEKLHWLYEIVVGESFSIVERDTKGRPYQQVPISPWMVVDVAKPDREWFTIRGLYNGSYNYFPQT